MGVKPRLAIVVGPKGRGSNMRAIIEACERGEIGAQVELVISPKDRTPAVQFAREAGVPVQIVDPDSPEFASELLSLAASADLVCLAGYLRLLPSEVVAAFRGRIINIHPALLPEFGGRGMYGMRVHEAVIAAGAKESGCTVHYVTEEYDQGDPILQLRCEVAPDDDAESLAAKVLELEHRAYPAAINKVLGLK